MKFSIVIPIIPKHHKFLPSLIKSLAKNTIDIQEILIVSSSTDESSELKLRSLIKSLHLDVSIQVIAITSKQSAGENRNSGWNAATAEYVMFLDADDWYSTDRTCIISKVIEATSADLIIHNYWSLKPRFFLKKKVSLDMTEWLRSQELIAATWEGSARNVNQELGIRGDTNIIARDRFGNSWPIQQGHVTIRREVDIRFASRYGEDGLMLRDALQRGFEVLYIPNKLSIYNRISLHFILRSSYRHFKGLFLVN